MTLNRTALPDASAVVSHSRSISLPGEPPGEPSDPAFERGGSRLISTILRLPTVKAATGYSRSTIYLRIAQGLWPRPVSLGPRSVGWPASEVASINAARIAGKSDIEIGKLVARLQEARKECLW